MKVGIIGAGVFGIALADILYKNGNNITLWSKFEDEINQLNETRMCKSLEGYNIPNDIKFTTDIKETINDANIIIIAIPANYVKDSIFLMKDFYNNQHICIASKGIDEENGKYLHDVVGEILNTNKIGIISGPSFAIDIVNNVPSGVTLASNNMDTTNAIVKALSNNLFKITTTNDMIGVSICGCLKNIIAIGAGILDGMGYPSSTNSLLITLALKDIKKLIINLNGNENTILDLAGVGDILLTCTSVKSRNYTFGKMIGQSDNQQVIDNYVHNNTIEGFRTLLNMNIFVDNLNINTPLIKLIQNIVIGKTDKIELIQFLINNE